MTVYQQASGLRAGAYGLGLKFETAPPGKPDSFQAYLDAKPRRESR